MSQSLSQEEFQRMQAQLLELRAENYRLGDELRRSGAELSGLRQRLQGLEKELGKANKALSKSKRAQEVEALLGETQMLQGKLQSQEEDFRLQNSTLLTELAKLCAQVEALEEENQRLRGGAGDAPPTPGPPPGPPPKDPPPESAPPPSPPPPQTQPGGSGTPPGGKEEPAQELRGEGEGGDAPPRDPPGPSAEEEVAELQAEVARLTEKLRQEQERAELWEFRRAEEIREFRSQTGSLREELESRSRACEEQREELEKRLAEAKDQLQAQSEAHERHREELESRVAELRGALGDSERLRELQEKQGQALSQELKDLRDAQRILEKKGSGALKDLRRQLQQERRRGDRLQERLQEVLAAPRTRTALEDLGLEGSPGRGGGDSSSSSAPGSTKSGSGSPGGGSGGVPGGVLGALGGSMPGGGGLTPAEVSELFQRLAQSQQERWMLEEKVRHLELSSASMAEDLCRKNSIIQSFVRDSRLEAVGPPCPPRRGEEGLWEMNKKLQNMLEEQLTKNLHLSQDLEVLTQELSKLNKERGAPPGPP